MVAAVTGWVLTDGELRAAARRIHHLKKLFNQRQGWSASEDTLPARFFTAPAGACLPAQAGPADRSAPTIDAAQFQVARSRYYELRGWGPDGVLHTDPDVLRDLRLS
jgi:aldehyde:ferredoxin oxidoreductase